MDAAKKLDKQDLEMCRMMGITPEQYLASREALEAAGLLKPRQQVPSYSRYAIMPSQRLQLDSRDYRR